MNLNNLKKLRGDKLDAVEAIVRQAETDNRAFTPEEKTQYDALMAEVDSLADTIQRGERAFAAESRGTSPRAGMPEQTVSTAPENFRAFGEFLQAVAHASKAGTRIDPRLIEERATGLGEAVGSEGGFLVQTDYSIQLLTAAVEQSIVVPKCRAIPITNPSNGVKLPAISETSRADGSRSGGVQMYWKGEAALKTHSKPAFRLVELALKKLVGLTYVTDELIEDAAALEAYVRAAFAAEAAFKLDDAVIRGTGAGIPLGVLNAPCLVTVAKETGQVSQTIIPENIVNMFSRMYAGGVRNAVWLVNQDVFPQLYLMGQTIGTGGAPVYMPPGGLSGSPYSTLLGRPVIPIEQCSTLGTVGDIIFADFTQYLVATKGGLQTASSIHVNFAYDETVFRFVYRFDGSPAWASALTPYQGTATTGPFIALATRS